MSKIVEKDGLKRHERTSWETQVSLNRIRSNKVQSVSLQRPTEECSKLALSHEAVLCHAWSADKRSKTALAAPWEEAVLQCEEDVAGWPARLMGSTGQETTGSELTTEGSHTFFTKNTQWGLSHPLVLSRAWLLDVKKMQDFGYILVVCNAKTSSCDLSYISLVI